jgi:iron complex outermembrane receptor protein
VGVISYINDVYMNIDRQTYQAVDIETRYDWKTSRAGDFRLIANATWVYDFSYNDTQYTGTYNQPRWRSAFTFEWERGDWSAALLVAHIGRFQNYDEDGYIRSQIIVNPEVTYSGLWKTRLTVGARNALDRDPPFDPHSSSGWDTDIHDPEPLFVYVRLGKDW